MRKNKEEGEDIFFNATYLTHNSHSKLDSSLLGDINTGNQEENGKTY
jgi:hypothetical protein